MQVAVKAPRTEFRVEGNQVPPWLIDELRRRYGRRARVVDERGDGEGSVRIEESEWYRRVRAETTPADALRIYRQNRGLSQSALARLLGPGFRKQNVSDMENGRRGISKATAKKLAQILSTSADRFI